MLAIYQANTTGLLQLPGAPTALYPSNNLNTWINLARGQLAGETRCIRFMGTLDTVVNQRAYNFSSIDTGTSSVNGIGGVIHVRAVTYDIGDGEQWIPMRPWEWFLLYHLNNPVPQSGPPGRWSQFAQGAASAGTGSGASGSLYIDPPPDFAYTLNLDCACYPIALTDDNTVEAIPVLWTDAVSFFAAYYALLSAQTGARRADADAMYGAYQAFIARARIAANPDVNMSDYQGSVDPAGINKLGIIQQQGRGR